jgi:glycerol uptake facilitator-like aquaporin
VLVALILALGPASGAHFNPAVTLVEGFFGGLDAPTALGYVAAQVAGAIAGAVTANLMFHLPAVTWSTTERSAGYLWFAEASPPSGCCW